jgi:hypothetical protein
MPLGAMKRGRDAQKNQQGDSVFAFLSPDEEKILACYDSCIKSACPLSAQKEKLLSKNILSLAHNLTDERSGRRVD